MTIAAWVAWGSWTLTLVAGLAVLVLRLARLDERSLLAVRLVCLGDEAVLVVATPYVLFRLAVGPGPFTLDDLPPTLPWALVLVALLLGHRPNDRGRAPDAAGPELRVATVNIERDTAAAKAIATHVQRFDADVLLVQEYTPATADACAEAGLLAAYPHRAVDRREGWFGSALLSRHPITDWRTLTLGQRPLLSADVAVGTTTLTVVPVHIQAPIFARDLGPWRDGIAGLGRLAADTAGPVVLAGDWNAVLGHSPMQRLLARRALVDAHRATARWWRPRWIRTWPTDRRLVPTLLCLDHVLVTPDIEVLDVRQVPLAGTDHKAVVARLRLPAP